MKQFLDKYKLILAFIMMLFMIVVANLCEIASDLDTQQFAFAAPLATLINIGKGRPNEAPGFKYRILIFLHELVTAHPVITCEYPSTPDKYDNACTGGFTMKETETAIEVYSDDPPSFESSAQGEDYGSFSNSGKFYVKGDSVQLAKFASVVNGRPCSMIVEKIADSAQQIYGSEDNPCKITPKRAAGNRITEKSGYECAIATTSVYPYFSPAKNIGIDGTAAV